MLTFVKNLQPIRHIRVQPGWDGRREAFKIRIGFWGPLYDNDNEEPQIVLVII